MTRKIKHDTFDIRTGFIAGVDTVDIRVTIKRDGEWRMRACEGWDD